VDGTDLLDIIVRLAAAILIGGIVGLDVFLR